MRYLRLTIRLLKGLYDILASYLLGWVLLFALLAFGLQLLLSATVTGLFGFDSVEMFWGVVEDAVPWPSRYLRLVGFGLVQVLLLVWLRRPVFRIKAQVEAVADRIGRWRRGAGKRYHRLQALLGTGFSVGVTLLLIPFVIQPTLVPRGLAARLWVERAANLADGTASAALVESVVGLYRRWASRPIPSRGLGEEGPEPTWPDLPEDIDPEEALASGPDLGRLDEHTLPSLPAGRMPLMDRWDGTIRAVVGRDRRAFAMLKALIWVESGGRQFAVSRTGCIGLTQFCGRTARSQPYRAVFGLGQVYPCQCNGACGVPRSVQRDLESGDMDRLLKHRPTFPCELGDARFDPQKAIQAAWLYVRRMHQAFGGNLLFIYIAYNSGPAAAQRLWQAIGQNPRADLRDLEPALASALVPFFGQRGHARARALLRVHLPKLMRAYDRYLLVGTSATMSLITVDGQASAHGSSEASTGPSEDRPAGPGPRQARPRREGEAVPFVRRQDRLDFGCDSYPVQPGLSSAPPAVRGGWPPCPVRLRHGQDAGRRRG